MPEAVAVEFIDPSGDPLRIEWRTEALAALDPATRGTEPAWRLAGELDWDEVEALRVLSGRLADGDLIAVAAIRPAGAAGHGDELVAGLAGTPDEIAELARVLLSTEYGREQEPRRLGLELYREAGGLPLRVAADATAAVTGEEDGVRRISVALTLRTPGESGAGVLDVLERAP